MIEEHTTSRHSKNILCHACMDPYPASTRTSCPKCKTFQYCSEECQLSDWEEGGHRFKCSLVQSLVESRHSTVQISSQDEPFPEYNIVLETTLDNNSILDQDWRKITEVKPTGKNIYCPIGDQGTILLFPHQFDSAGSFLVQIRSSNSIGDNSADCSKHKKTTSKNCKIILCDIFALESASPWFKSQHNSSQAIQSKSDILWKEGLQLWYKRDLLSAITLFQKSLDCYQWNNTDYKNSASSITYSSLLDIMSQPSTIRRHPLRSQLSKR